MKDSINVGLLGFGTVGTGVMQVLAENAHEIKQKVGLPIRVKSVLVRDINKKRSFNGTFTVTDKIEDILNDEGITIEDKK